ncbi:hypothetical protein PHOSAC3_120082 [Mesotoga infera]|nr:hypothetical protein PHOSAC3_120082 [Mesotoga infera]
MRLLFAVFRPSQLFTSISMAKIFTRGTCDILVMKTGMHFEQWENLSEFLNDFNKSLRVDFAFSKNPVNWIKRTQQIRSLSEMISDRYNGLILFSDQSVIIRSIVSNINRMKVKLGLVEDGAVVYSDSRRKNTISGVIKSILLKNKIILDRGYGECFLTDSALMSFSCHKNILARDITVLGFPLFSGSAIYLRDRLDLPTHVYSKASFISTPLATDRFNISFEKVRSMLDILASKHEIERKNIAYYPHPSENKDQTRYFRMSGFEIINERCNIPVENILIRNHQINPQLFIAGIESSALYNLSWVLDTKIVSFAGILGIDLGTVFHASPIAVPSNIDSLCNSDEGAKNVELSSGITDLDFESGIRRFFSSLFG